MAKYITTMPWPGNIMLTSDLHIGDEHVIKKDRGFATVEEHDKKIWKALKSQATQGNTLIVLGDVGDGDWAGIIRKLKCYKVLITGNHDTLSREKYKNVFDEVYYDFFPLTPNVMGSHQPWKVPDYMMNVHGHLHGAVLKGSQYICVNIFDNNFKLTNLWDIESKARKLLVDKDSQGPMALFSKEWFADNQIFYGSKWESVGVDSNQHYYRKAFKDTLYKSPTDAEGFKYAIAIKNKEDGILNTNILFFANEDFSHESFERVANSYINDDNELYDITYKGDLITSIRRWDAYSHKLVSEKQ